MVPAASACTAQHVLVKRQDRLLPGLRIEVFAGVTVPVTAPADDDASVTMDSTAIAVAFTVADTRMAGTHGKTPFPSCIRADCVA